MATRKLSFPFAIFASLRSSNPQRPSSLASWAFGVSRAVLESWASPHFSIFPMWLVCQIGAREHYGIARALHRTGQLGALVTDFWVPPGSMAGHLPGAQRLADRYHPDLASAPVHAPNLRMFAFELLARLCKRRGWERVLARNALFQREALKILADIRPPTSDLRHPPPDITLFSYSYAALELFRYAKQRGWKTVLGQIDPGPGEDAIVRRLRARYPEWVGPNEQSPPDVYWDHWREECALADRIVVNSAWSRALLIEAGIEAAKIEVVALAVEEEGGRGRESEVGGQKSEVRGQNAEPSGANRSAAEIAELEPTSLARGKWTGANATCPVRGLAGGRDQRALANAEQTGEAQSGMAAGNSDPAGHSELTSDLRPLISGPPSSLISDLRSPTSDLRPLRVLWLGQVNVRKGIQDLVAAVRMLVDAPVRIDVVGPHGPLPPGLPDNMVFHGAVARSEAGGWYEQADVFVLPTYSDGFALTQLEAMAQGVPVIATPCCGEVVEDGVNGWLVPAGDPQALAERIRQIARNPQCLAPMRDAAQQTAARFGLDRMVAALVAW